jgi:3,4-dihydroxy 2-butanone 4-phosphate synthase/GTP cyclohydrolase II
MVILVDDEDRENEGDLCMAADLVTPEAINFMATHGRGLICLTLTEEQVDRLNLPMMQAPGRPGPPLGTAFTVSIEARTGVTTGISAADRAHTIRVATACTAKPDDIVTPGHVFPLRARRGGVLMRTGQTEGSVDLARLAGQTPAGVICEIMKDDGTMARMADLEVFAQRHQLRIVTIADLIQYRLVMERLVERKAERLFPLDITGSEWRVIVYEYRADGRSLMAFVRGDISGHEPVLCRVHSGSLFGDLFASTRRDGGRHLREAFQRIDAESRGVVVYFPPRTPPADELEAYVAEQNAPSDAHGGLALPGGGSTLREFGLGAQVMADLGLHKVRLLTNNPRKIAGLCGYGLEVVEHVPMDPKAASREPERDGTGEVRGAGPRDGGRRSG